MSKYEGPRTRIKKSREAVPSDIASVATLSQDAQNIAYSPSNTNRGWLSQKYAKYYKLSMPCCAILNCKNESRKINVSSGGVSYHRFPQDPYIKEKWIDATGRPNWMPSKSSTICSEHFEDEDKQTSNKGYKYLNDKAIPTKHILIFKDDNSSERNESDPSRKRLQGTPPLTNPSISTDVTPTKKARQAINIEFTNSPMCWPPFKGKCIVIKQLLWTQSKLKKQNLKVKRLQSQNRRLNKKMKNMEELLKSLQDKAIKSEDLDSLKNVDVKVESVM